MLRTAHSLTLTQKPLYKTRFAIDKNCCILRTQRLSFVSRAQFTYGSASLKAHTTSCLTMKMTTEEDKDLEIASVKTTLNLVRGAVDSIIHQEPDMKLQREWLRTFETSLSLTLSNMVVHYRGPSGTPSNTKKIEELEDSLASAEALCVYHTAEVMRCKEELNAILQQQDGRSSPGYRSLQAFADERDRWHDRSFVSQRPSRSIARASCREAWSHDEPPRRLACRKAPFYR